MATALAASVTGGITIGASSAGHRGKGSPLIEFQAVGSARLDAIGVRLTATAAIPRLSAGDAGQAASRALGGAAVREAHFAQCDVDNIQPEIHQPCWAVSVDPSQFVSNGPPGSKIVFATYSIALIDEATGKLLLAENGA